MEKVIVYSLLLIFGLVGSQMTGDSTHQVVEVLTMLALSYIMVHVGYEFEIDRKKPKQYVWDYLVAATAAAMPWVLCSAYFVFAMSPRQMWGCPDLWKGVLLEARFSSPTSAGVLFSMLAAAGLGATWVFKKARILAIFDDLDTILLMIPLQMLMVGFRWQLGVIVFVVVGLIWIAWKYMHSVSIPVTWPWVSGYAAAITLFSQLLLWSSGKLNPELPIHVEVLLPAFVLGCVMKIPAGADPHSDDAVEGTEEGPEGNTEQLVSTVVSACFMVLVGLSMPSITHPAEGRPSVLHYAGISPDVIAAREAFPGWGVIALHVLAITILSNLGKMVPAMCYRTQATFRERLALSVGMYPRGEVGAGVLVIALSYGISGPSLTVAVLSLATNLLCTGLFIVIVKRLIAQPSSAPFPTPALSEAVA